MHEPCVPTLSLQKNDKPQMEIKVDVYLCCGKERLTSTGQSPVPTGRKSPTRVMDPWVPRLWTPNRKSGSELI